MVNRSHEQCDQCEFEEYDPPFCKGHASGPTNCMLFFPNESYSKTLRELKLKQHKDKITAEREFHLKEIEIKEKELKKLKESTF